MIGVEEKALRTARGPSNAASDHNIFMRLNATRLHSAHSACQQEDRGAWWSGETAYPHGSPYSVVPVDRGAAFLLLPTAAQLCPLQLLLQLSDLAVRDGGERKVRQRQSILVPSPS